ncbi:hypothetical protein I546_3490 [Mycobacterium kansasii 732]|nr:hypothetical protein I546_3490 [Mycobacterium kansasii 732]
MRMPTLWDGAYAAFADRTINGTPKLLPANAFESDTDDSSPSNSHSQLRRLH